MNHPESQRGQQCKIKEHSILRLKHIRRNRIRFVSVDVLLRCSDESDDHVESTLWMQAHQMVDIRRLTKAMLTNWWVLHLLSVANKWIQMDTNGCEMMQFNYILPANMREPKELR